MPAETSRGRSVEITLCRSNSGAELTGVDKTGRILELVRYLVG